MKEYEVTAYYSETVKVRAGSEDEAVCKAQEQLKNINTVLVADSYEVECLE